MTILKCKKCKRYTIKEICPVCNSKELVNIHPPKFSPVDKYWKIKFYAVLERKGIKPNIHS